MAEITLRDLLAWEPRLRIAAAGNSGAGIRLTPTDGTPTGELDRELSWAVTARATAPMLPMLRGGELVLLPGRVLAESAVALPPLLRELAGHGVVGVVVDGTAPVAPPLPVLTAGAPVPELEGEINRLLTERRGELYRAGTELERFLADLTTTGGEVGQVLDAAANALAAPVAIVDGRGTPVATSNDYASPARFGGAPSGTGWQKDRLAIALDGGMTLWIGPVPPARRALARLVGARIGAAAGAAMARAAQLRPRGPARSAALGALLSDAGSRVDLGVRTAVLGLASDGTYRVALAAPGIGASGLQRALAPLGIVHDAGIVDDVPAAVLEVHVDPAGSTRRPERSDGILARASALTDADAGWLALSSPVTDPRGLPAAAREARYLAALFGAGLLARSIARFDAVADIGPYRLLYPLWGTPDLARYAGDALGDLPAGDRRGVLRHTLLAYLETGGSHVEAAARLGVHRNTLAYRLKQIAMLSGRDPANPSCRLLLHLALLAARLPPVPFSSSPSAP